MKKKTEDYKTEEKIKNVMNMIEFELRRAFTLYGKFNSFHEGYAILWEEFDELKNQVWMKTKLRDHQKMTEEAIQIGAMAARFVVDLL